MWAYPRDGERSDEKVASGDDTLRRRTGNNPFDVLITVDAVDIVTVAGEQSRDRKEANSHERRAEHESHTTTPAVDEKNGGDGHDEVDDILDRGRDEVGIARKAGHLDWHAR